VTLLRLAAALTRAWVRLYTRGLDHDRREARRAELESDVWEHVHDADEAGRPPAAAALEIARRLVGGVPADLTWRLEHRRRGGRARVEGGRSMRTAIRRHGMVALTGALGVWLLAMAAAVWVDPSAPASTLGKALVSVAVATAGLAVLTGLVARHAGRRGSRELIALGAVVGGVTSIWAVLPTVVAGAVLVWLYRPRRRGGAAQAA
jgi:hypothetical protein